MAAADARRPPRGRARQHAVAVGVGEHHRLHALPRQARDAPARPGRRSSASSRPVATRPPRTSTATATRSPWRSRAAASSRGVANAAVPITARVAPACEHAPTTSSRRRRPPPHCTGTPTRGHDARRRVSSAAGTAVAGAVEVDHVQAPRAGGHPRARRLQRVVGVDGLVLEAALPQPHRPPAADVDGRMRASRGGTAGLRRHAGANGHEVAQQRAGRAPTTSRGGTARRTGRASSSCDGGGEALAVLAAAQDVRLLRPRARASARGRGRTRAGRPSMSGDGRRSTRPGSSRCAAAWRRRCAGGAPRRAAAPGPRRRPARSERSNSSCIPRQMPSSGVPALQPLAHSSSSRLERAQVRHGPGKGADAGQHEAVGAAQRARGRRSPRRGRRARSSAFSTERRLPIP